MRKQTRHRFVATNYNRDERHLPFLLYNFYFMRFAQRRKGKLAKTKIFLSLTSGVCFFALIFENYHTIPLAQNEIHLQLQLKSPIQDDGALVLYIKANLPIIAVIIIVAYALQDNGAFFIINKCLCLEIIIVCNFGFGGRRR